MSKFMDENFLLKNQKAKELYQNVKDLPIFDYHCHLEPKEIYENCVFHNLTQLWLECDHYKWRVMRNAGINENLITTDKTKTHSGNCTSHNDDENEWERFFAFASCLPNFPGNPVYHWAHLELKKYFGIDLPICRENAKKIWDLTCEKMQDGSFCAKNLIKKSNVDTIFTTDNPLSDLEYHKLLKSDKTFSVFPSFRSDAALNIEKPEFSQFLSSLSNITQTKIDGFDVLVSALEKRLDFFIENGCKVSDISFPNFIEAQGDRKIADNALKKILDSKNSTAVLSSAETSEYKYCLLKELALLFGKKNITMQIHTGVERNVNQSRFKKLGADCGIDSIGNALDIKAAGKLFNDIEVSGGLPRTIVYTLNPNSYYPLATMIGDFAGNLAGKLQLGAAWWFMDHRDGIEEQLKIFANTSGLGLFNGMLTDSRSFTSYARHDYFRRILCSVIGEWIENGEYPDDDNSIELVKNISFYNAKKNFS